jgi:hypothetical protein
MSDDELTTGTIAISGAGSINHGSQHARLGIASHAAKMGPAYEWMGAGPARPTRIPGQTT